MTACKDVQDVNLGKKAVSAALAGTLAVGMVPAVALAAPADDAVADDGIETLNMSGAYDFSKGSVTGLTIGGKTVSVVNGAATIALPADNQAKLSVNQITTGQGTVLNSTATKSLWDVQYTSATQTTPADVTDALLTTPGVYTIIVTATDANYAPIDGNGGNSAVHHYRPGQVVEGCYCL